MSTALKRLGALAVLPLVASGCGLFDSNEADLDFAEHEERLTSMFNESVRLTEELDAAEARIVQDCLEAQGFTVHDPSQFGSWGPAERETFLEEAPYEPFLPTVEDAAYRGFWQWTTMDGAETAEDGTLYDAWEEYQNSRGIGFPPWFHDEDEMPDFYSLSAEDQYAWYVAYGGEQWAVEMHGYLVGIDIETEMYAWQEEMKDLIARAQDYLAA